MNSLLSATIPLSCLALSGLASAEIESLIAPPEFLLAGAQAIPERIGPQVRHHHDNGIEFELEFSAGGETRYVSEGRDNLPGEGGILWGTGTGHFHILGGAIFGEVTAIAAWESSYQEINLATGYEFESGPLTLGGAVTWLSFPSDGQDDLEFTLAARWLFECGGGLAAEGTWSLEAEGWFGELEAFYELPVGDRFTLVPAVFVGVNQGYVTGEHDGFNHLGVRLKGSFTLTEHLAASFFAAFSEPLAEATGDTLRDLFWMGSALTLTF